MSVMTAPHLGTSRTALRLVWREELFFKELVFLGINP